jgi:hypothetical protein
MKRYVFLALLGVSFGLLALSGPAFGDNGNAPTTLNFFSGGGGAHADWLATVDQPPGDVDNQAIRLVTTTDPHGYAGIYFHHVTGIPADAFPDSSFWLRSNFVGPSLGSPRLIVVFQTAAGVPDGDAELTPNSLTTTWRQISDASDYPDSGWDIHGGTCGYGYHQVWSVAQACHAGDVVSQVFLTTDPYGVEHRIDDIEVNYKRFSSASDNGGGNNDPAGPDATTDPSLIPPLELLLPQQ